MEEAVEVISYGALCKFSISEKEVMTVQELGIDFDTKLAIQSPCEQSCSQSATSYQEERCNSEDIKMPHDICQSVFSDGKKLKGLEKCLTFPCSEMVQPCSSFIEEREGLLITVAESQRSLSSENPVYMRSTSMPASFKLVSAMKGGREQNGKLPKIKLRVQWAPEVYDPPATTMSHTVKNHHRRPKAKKRDYQKQKQNKGKSSRKSNHEKIYAAQRRSESRVNPSEMRGQASSSRLLSDCCGQTTLEVFNYASGGQEAKCGSSYLQESLAKVHLRMGEAS